MSKPKPASRPSAARKAPREADDFQACAAWDGESRIEDLVLNAHNPELKADHFKKTRAWSMHWFIDAVLQLRLAFYNYGFRLVPKDAKKKADREASAAWMDDETNKKALIGFVWDAWREWLLQRNVISLWRAKSVRPVVLNPEDVKFTDKLGVEMLTIKHELTPDEVKSLKGWTAAEKASLLAKKELKLQHDDMLFEFEVLKSNKLGCGLAWPGLTGVFQALNQSDSLEAGDAVLAHVTRTVLEQHKKGHEIRAGNMQGAAKHFLKPEQAAAIEKALKGKLGHVRMATNFDHDLVFPGVDPKRFAAEKYDGVINRLLWWALPLGHMVMARGVSPNLFEMLFVLAQQERAAMALHLNKVISEVFTGLPEVRVVWSNRCFRDQRIAAELIKMGLTAGPLSQTTFLEDAGYDPEQEREHKQTEHGLPPAQTLPLMDPNHGTQPGRPGKTNGRPAGTGDPTS